MQHGLMPRNVGHHRSQKRKEMHFIIREARPADYLDLNAVFEEADELHRRALPHVFQKPEGLARRESFFAQIIEDKNSALLVAEKENHIVGFVHVFIRETPAVPIIVPRRYAVVENLAVTKRFRRFGIAKALMERAQRWAKTHKATQVELNVWEFNKGTIAFYRKLGYTTANRRLWKSLE
jgi:ribosomal protein S18 acetylase RimI-like enzyme